MNQLLLPRGPWCCERGERLGVTVCPECAEYSSNWQPSETMQLAGGYVCVVHPDTVEKKEGPE